MSLRDLAGQTFGRWSVVGRAGTDRRGEAVWFSRCECGNTAQIIGSNLRTGKSRSCGCLRVEVSTAANLRHGHARTKGGEVTPTFVSWQSMIQRCTNPRRDTYRFYGGQGVTVCPEWRNDFATFLRDMGQRPAGHSIDRIDPSGDYTPANCRWATRSQQARNTRKRATCPAC